VQWDNKNRIAIALPLVAPSIRLHSAEMVSRAFVQGEPADGSPLKVSVGSVIVSVNSVRNRWKLAKSIYLSRRPDLQHRQVHFP
jgi:hypothetical protein